MKLHTITTDRFTMDYGVFGNGKRPFVLLPGVSVCPVLGSADAIEAAYHAFTSDYTIYLFERRREAPEGYSVEAMAEDTAEVMTFLGIRDAVLCGCSQGGMMGLCLAVEHPELVGRLAVISSMAKYNPLIRRITTEWVSLAKGDDVTALNRAIFDKIYDTAYRERFKEAFMAAENAGTIANMRQFAVIMQACYDFDVSDRLESIRCPTLILGAKQDEVLSQEASRFMAEHIPGAELYLYEDYGHAVYDEAEDCKERLLRFFAE